MNNNPFNQLARDSVTSAGCLALKALAANLKENYSRLGSDGTLTLSQVIEFVELFEESYSKAFTEPPSQVPNSPNLVEELAGAGLPVSEWDGCD